jgi:dienelactone hydrolase
MRRAVVASLLLLMAGCTTTPTDRPQATEPTGAQRRPVSFSTADGITLHGTLFGTGTTAVVLSNMGDNDPRPWEQFAPVLAQRGYTVLTYSFRYPIRTNNFTAAMAQSTVPDLEAAVEFARHQGATRLVLIGASLGADTTAMVAGSAGAAAVVIIAGTLEVVGYDFKLSAAQLAALTAPKLFVASKDDTNTPYADSQALYELVPQPKRFETFAGGVHGVRLFDTAQGDRLRQLLIAFVTTTAPA